jgi:transposase-like protein
MTTMTAAQVRAQTAPVVDQVPDPEVPERPRPPRVYPAAYKLRILEEYEQLDKQGKGALLRREGLYTSLISEWRRQRDKGALAALQQRRGRPPVDPRDRELARLERENARLREQVAKQAKVLEVQGELSALLSRLAASSAEPDPSEPTDHSGQRS